MNTDLNYQTFYQLCNQEDPGFPFKEFLETLKAQNKLDVDMLSAGLLGTLASNKTDYVSVIGTYILQNDIFSDASSVKKQPFSLEKILANFNPNDEVEAAGNKYREKTLKANRLANIHLMFNAATTFNQTELAHQLDEKYSILHNAMTNDMGKSITLKTGAHATQAEINSDGSLAILKMRGGPISSFEEKTNYYCMNPFLFNLKNFNPELLDTLLNKYDIDASIVKHGLVRNIFLNNSEAVVYLFSHPKCANIIKNSYEIKAFLHSDANWLEQKKEARIALSMINLRDDLPQKNENLGKMKI